MDFWHKRECSIFYPEAEMEIQQSAAAQTW